MKQRSKNTMYVVAMTALLLSSYGAAQDGGRYRPEDGSFSYEPPSGWQLRAFGGQKYEIAFGPAANGFAPNIVVIGEDFPGSLDDYVDANLAAMNQVSPGIDIPSRSDFQTDAARRAVKIATESVTPGIGRLHQTFYFFDAGARKFTVTCSRLAGSNDALDASFDTAMKTFVVGSS